MATEHARSSPAPPKGMSLQEELDFYKEQYEQLEAELNEFQTSSQDLEKELEKDIEASEKRERQLKEKLESLNFEVEEWKAKYRQAKTEANNAQNLLQKEITAIRDAHRTLQLKLRDIEVANDDFERQARHQNSSLEDLESKYNVSIERGVMLEEEIRNGEQERENLRIETQRQRDELADLKIEAEITQEKLRLAEETIERFHTRKPKPLDTDSLRPPSPASEGSTSATTISSPTISTPPPSKSDISTVQTTPPSPPLSDASAKAHRVPITPAKQRTREPSATPKPGQPKPGQSTIRPPRHSRGPSVPGPSFSSSTRGPAPPATSTITKRPPRFSSRPSISNNEPLPRSGSLYQMRDLKSKAAKLGERVHRMHSKLPAPTTTPPRASPRSVTLGSSAMPSSVTIRSGRKRASASTTTSGDQPVSRLSFGMSVNSRVDGSRPPNESRPSSRASATSHVSAMGNSQTRPLSRGSIGRPPSRSSIARPPSRTSTSGQRTSSSIGYYAERRPRSSISGSFAALHGPGSESRSGTPGPRAGTPGPRAGTPGPRLGHGHSQSVSGMHSFTSASGSGSDDPEGLTTPLARRTTLEKGLSGIPTPSGLPRRQSGGPRRQSNVGLDGVGDMPPPQRTRKLSEVGETF